MISNKSHAMEHRHSEKPEMFNILRVVIILLSIMILYEYYHRTEPKTIVQVKTPKFTTLSPTNTSEYIVKDVYEQLIDLKSFNFTINSQPCQEYTAGLLLVIIISSNPLNYDKRMVIRDTWGRNVDSTKVVFLIGERDNEELSRKIVNESLIYNDIVQGNFIDAYRNMTYKHVMGLKWVAHHCPMAKYVLKTDDDVAVHMTAFRHFLARELSPWGARGLIMCQVNYHSAVLRTKSKWVVLPSEFIAKYYPDYCFGWAVLYSQDVVPKLLTKLQTLPYFWIDDVHVTGVAAEDIGIARTNLGTLVLNGKRKNLLTTSGLKYTGQFLFGPPNLNIEQMSEIMNAIYLSE